MTTTSLTLGIDIGGTKVLGGVVDVDGRVVAMARRETPADDVAKSLDFIIEVIEELAAGHVVNAVGVGAAGWIDATRSRVLFAPNLAWRNEPLREFIAERVSLPIVVENDANAAAWAEFRYGAARDATESAVLVTVGTGIGSGIIAGGALVRGAHGIAAEVGHVRVVPAGRLCGCGRSGCLEQYASGTALGRYARELAEADRAGAGHLLELAGGSVEAITGPLVTRAARAGDPVAQAAFGRVGQWLGSGLADLVNVLDPEVLVIGDGVIEAGELLLAPTRSAFIEALGARRTLPVAPVVAAKLGNLAGVVGAADLARR
ncbi:MAG: ROK family glucokinase [Micromonosporaceae bacterium]